MSSRKYVTDLASEIALLKIANQQIKCDKNKAVMRVNELENQIKADGQNSEAHITIAIILWDISMAGALFAGIVLAEVL